MSSTQTLGSRALFTPAIAVDAAATLLAVAVLVVGPFVAPAQLGYLQGRFAGIVQSRSVLSDPNVQGRLRQFDDIVPAVTAP